VKNRSARKKACQQKGGKGEKFQTGGGEQERIRSSFIKPKPRKTHGSGKRLPWSREGGERNEKKGEIGGPRCEKSKGNRAQD